MPFREIFQIARFEAETNKEEMQRCEDQFGPQITDSNPTEEKDLKMTHTQKYSAKDAGQTVSF
jgi:hypothetical protein